MKTRNSISEWDWVTLVASWRYFEDGRSISAACFPGKIVRRFWGDDTWGASVRYKIAHQFYDIDHMADDEGYDTISGGLRADAWARFHCFCKGWVHGFYKIDVDTPDGVAHRVCFQCGSNWYPVDDYITNPDDPPYIPPEKVLESIKL